MCSSTKTKTAAASEIDGRRVLQPTCNGISTNRKSPTPPKLKKSLTFPNSNNSLPSPKAKKPSKRCSSSADSTTNSLNSSTEKPPSPKPSPTGTRASLPPFLRKKPKSSVAATNQTTLQPSVIADANLKSSVSSLLDDGIPGSLAAAQRQQAAIMHEKRKMKIAHYGRAASFRAETRVAHVPADEPHLEKRCTFITPNSDPVYVAYHDQEWGVPVHDDNMLFELLVLSGAQVGLDWTTILKKRDDFRAAFCGFDAETVSKLTEKRIISISEEYEIDLPRVRGVVDNSKRILGIKKDFGTLDKYVWGFVNHKVISPQYRSCRKMPAKTSKSETISKDMVRRGFRFVGPTIIYSFMQAAGLTNDHLVSCPRHSKLAS